MKHFLCRLSMAALLLCGTVQLTLAQPMQTVPMDKNVRIGKLENGLTYYIRHNALPENRVEFHIAQKVGSILEEPEQRGLAHFLEHMAFNGTKNFPGNDKGPGIIPWCETKGIKFGTDLNAYTGVDQTVYRVSNVPTDNPAVLDSCLLILHDWSGAILLAEKEIDKERGVIREEWRSRNSGMMRIITNALPTLYAGTKYADCMPIGSIDVINNFPYQLIRDYYAKWYRPDQQGIIIVGDINVDEMEAKLKKTFADVKAPVNPAERIYYPVTDNDETYYYVGTDKEVTSPSVSIFIKHDATPDSLKNTVAYYVSNYIISMATTMLNGRLNEIRQQADAPFTSASVGYGSFFVAQTKDAFSVNVSSKIDGIDLATKATLQEVERARRFGFTETEYARARANYLQSLESAYNEREKVKSINYAETYIRNFLEALPIPGIEYEYTMMNQIAPNVPLQAINQAMQQLVKDKNRVVLIAGPEKEGITYTTEHIAEALNSMSSFDLKPYEDKVSDEPLLSEEPKGGKIVSEKAGEIYGTTKLTLSNGVVVYVKPTDFKADQIIMKGTSRGGNSLFSNDEVLNFQQINGVALLGGLGNFNKTALTKALAGKRASVAASIGTTSENVSGSCSPKDFETMMQLTYLTFTAPRKDTEAFQAYKNQLKAALQNADANPMSAFNDTLSHELYGEHPRARRMKEDMVDQIDYDRILELYKDRYKDASDFKFYFVGNIDLEAVKPLIAKYLGGLPAINRKETFKDIRMNVKPGMSQKQFAKKQETPMATIFFYYTGDCKYDLRNNILLSILDQALDMVYTEEIREKEGGTYGVNCKGSLQHYPKDQLSLQIFFQTDPGKIEHLSKIVIEQLEKMAAEGPSAEHLQKIKEYMLKQYKDAQKENSYWLGNLDEYFFSGLDFTKDYESIVNGITTNDVRELLNNLLKQKNRIQVVMTVPEENENK